MGWRGNSSQFTLLHFLISKYKSVLSIQIMKLKTDFQATVGVKINTMQLNRHNIHPALVQKINSALRMRAGLRGSWENQAFLVGHRLPRQPINKQTHQYSLRKALTVHSILIDLSLVPAPCSRPRSPDTGQCHQRPLSFTRACSRPVAPSL